MIKNEGEFESGKERKIMSYLLDHGKQMMLAIAKSYSEICIP